MPRIKLKKKRGRKSKAEKVAMVELKIAEAQTRRLESQSNRMRAENLDDLLPGCGLQLSNVERDVPLTAVFSSASLPDRQAAIPFRQMPANRVTIPYDWADSTCDAKEIKAYSEKSEHWRGIDPNPIRDEVIQLASARNVRYRERSTAERGNSGWNDNSGTRHVREKEYGKVLCLLRFGVIAGTVTQRFNMLE